MDRGEHHNNLNSDRMVHAWVRYAEDAMGMSGRYASDLRYHFYTHRNSNNYRRDNHV